MLAAIRPESSDPSQPTSAMAPSDWTPPTEFGEYRILQPLGRGVSGHVYLAVDHLLDRQVVLLFAGDSEPGSEARRRFIVEARAAARLQHPNIVAVFRVGELDGRPFLVSEFARGETLQQLAKPVPWTRVHEIALALARGLAAAHRKGVLHRDIKPSNAILSDDGNPKLLDFGLTGALAVGDDGMPPGVPEYLAPEAWRAEPLTRRSDVYALGAVLYELCSGQPPHGDVPIGRLRQLVEDRDARPLAQVAPDVNPRFAAIIDRSLRREPGDRFASGEELREALDQLARGVAPVSVVAGNPYRGLRPFEAEHRAFFHGRNSEIEELVERLRSESFVLVAGDSGVGKSSICRAGVLPRISAGALVDGRTWSVVQMVPGRQPLAALANALAAPLGIASDELAQRLRDDPSSLVPEVRRRLGGAEGLLVFVDQLEELHTNSHREQAELVDDLLMRLSAGVAGVRVVATVRADFLTRVATLPRLGEEISRALCLLRPLTAEKMREVVVGPAESTGIRFESDALVTELVETTAHTDGGLPLLQFALALLWEARDQGRNLITAAALAALGGVGGALARHADTTVEALAPSQQAAVRRVMMRLVTLENTRARRSEVELTGSDPVAREALDALVRGRLVVAYEAETGSAYELGHEVLIHGWGTLGRWLHEDAAWRMARERLAQSATEWERLQRGREGLWSARQLSEIAGVEFSGLSPREEAFLAGSRRAVQLRRRVRYAIIAAIPVALAVVYGGAAWKARRDLGRQVQVRLDEAKGTIAKARGQRTELVRLRHEAFELFDGGDSKGGESSWSRTLVIGRDLERNQIHAGQALEGALVLDPRRGDVRALLGDVLYDRAALAEERGAEQREELIQRLALYDGDGERLRRWNAPAVLSVTTLPAGARLTLSRFNGDESGRTVSGAPRDLGVGPIAAVELVPGSYLLTATAPGRGSVRLPLVLARAEVLPVSIELPLDAAVPPGFVHIPAGRFQFGTAADEDQRRGFFTTVPVHTLRTGSYLIARSELTYLEWIEFLRSITPAERAKWMPSAGGGAGGSGSLKLEELADGAFRLGFQPGSLHHSARSDAKLSYPAGRRRAVQDWLRFPVTGISALGAVAYTAWLRTTGRVPGARLCSEFEWERAARGADGREFPHGNELQPDDANFDATYDKNPEYMGPDEVGSHPASRSPFGVDDLSGNAFEWTTSSLKAGDYVVRGGGFYHDPKTVKTPNRSVSPPTLSDATVGTRICSSLPTR